VLLHISIIAKLLDISLINKNTGIKSYKFEVYISRYYSDLIIDPALYKLVKITIIHINK
jgi:hypothetical protein